MTKFRVLDGLPVYGPAAITFSATGWGLHSEGYVIEFELPNNEKWVANFIGTLSGISTVVSHPNETSVLVIANGEGYIVDPLNKKLLSTFGGQICDLIPDQDGKTLIISNGIWLECFGKNGTLWKSKRISWDGIRKLIVDRDRITGEAYDPMIDRWLQFEVDKSNGAVKGGSYSGPN